MTPRIIRVKDLARTAMERWGHSAPEWVVGGNPIEYARLFSKRGTQFQRRHLGGRARQKKSYAELS
jgi:hypothetical protein